nr:hypothetical protein GCM10025730_00590 [Promicromonospora thailandica]
MGLAALSLLAEAGENRPLVCLVDDAQWLDQASALTLEFVARRLLAESVLIVFAVRTPSPGEPLAGLPELLVTGLSELDSRTLLDRVVIGPLDDQVRERVVAEAHGNPLALLELPRGRDAAQIAGFGRPDAQPLAGEIEEGFLRRVEALPVEARRLLVTAAAEPVGDGMLLRRAAERLGIAVDTAVSHVEASELITIGARIRFRHPLVRSAAYRAAGAHALREVHQALAEVTDGRSDPDRRAWHLACAAQGPDDAVADELERSAGRAQARGGVAAAAALLRSAAELTGDPARRARRTVDAAQATVHAGAFGPATTLLARAESGPLDEFLRARVNVLQAQIAFAVGRGKEAPPLLLAAARRLERFDVALARETHLEAVSAVIFAGHLAHEPGWREVGEVARAAPPAPRPRASDLLLDALAVRLTDGYSVSAPMIERVLDVFSHESVPVREAMRWLLLAGVVAADLWDLERWRTVATRHVTITRESGALSDLPLALDSCAVVHVFAGSWRPRPR